MKKITMYTDGACSGNPGIGGWGAVLIYQEEDGNIIKKEIFDGVDATTNNAMELSAVIFGLEALKESCEVDVYTDSKYVKDGITQWISNWKANGWKTASKQSVKNQELWQKLDALQAKHKVNLIWVKGHSGDYYNEIADSLARRGVEKVKHLIG